MTTKTAFLDALSTEIIATREWAVTEPKRLERFMGATKDTLESPHNVVAIDTPAFTVAWRAIGMKGKLTYKALRALPEA